jgi:hypothetical protein
MNKKLWKVERDGQTWRPTSCKKAYEIVISEAAEGLEHRLPICEVFVDERDGQGWQPYEIIDLRKLPSWPNK